MYLHPNLKCSNNKQDTNSLLIHLNNITKINKDNILNSKSNNLKKCKPNREGNFKKQHLSLVEIKIYNSNNNNLSNINKVKFNSSNNNNNIIK